MAGVAACRDGEIRDGAREDVEVFGESWREEGGGELDARGLEFVDGVRRSDLETDLLHGGDFTGVLITQKPHEAVRLAVDASDAVDGLALAGPMRGVAVGEVVGVRPDAEVWVVGDEGHGWRTLLGVDLGCNGKERGDKSKSTKSR